MQELHTGDIEAFVSRMPQLLDVYRRAFLDVYEPNPKQAARERLSLMQQHRTRPGLRLTYAQEDGELVGFCYTYRGQAGQWWHDVVRRSLDEHVGTTWLGDCREVVELHVLPQYQGSGLGRRLLRTALDGAAEQTAALSALDLPDSRALRLYQSEGFVPLLENFTFPGSGTRYVILAKELVPRSGEKVLVGS